MDALCATEPLSDLVFQPDNALSDEWLSRTLRAMRMHLDMEVAFISEFADGRRVFRHVDAAAPETPVQVGGSDLLEDSYCQRVVDGRLPELIQDARANAEACTLPVTLALPVGAHLSVPIRLKGGRVYGTFCCFSGRADHSLQGRDLAMMRVIAQILGDHFDRQGDIRDAKAEIAARVRSVLESDALTMVYQPIVNVPEDRTVGFEALSRFAGSPPRPPDIWFAEAAEAGLGIALEAKACGLALRGLADLPRSAYVSVNLSPETILTGEIRAMFGDWPLDRIVVEVTEHTAISHYDGVAAALRPLRAQGLRLAVDDAGAGYASFRHILSLAPDIIKLDVSITRNLDTDPSRRALARAIIGFGAATGSKIVAEGVETATELAVLRELGVNKAQGYFLGKPMPIGLAVDYMRGDRIQG